MSQELLRLHRNESIEYRSDCLYMQEILRQAGYSACLEDIQWAWSKYSEEYCSAGWMIIDGGHNEWVLSGLLNFLKAGE